MSLFASIFGPGPISSTHGGFWSWGGGYRTDSGSQVSEWNAQSIPAVYACVGIISDAIAQLPVNVYRKNPDGTRERQADHPVETLLNKRPNDRMTAFSFRRTMQSHVLLWGNGYSEIERRGNGMPTALWLALPDRTWPELTESLMLQYNTTIDRQNKVIEWPDMLHIPGMGFDGVVGYSPVSVARQAMGLSKAMEKFGGKFYDNDGRSGGFLKHPGKLSGEAIQRIQEGFSNQAGAENAWRPKVLEEGMEFQQTTISPEDAQFLEGRDFQVAEIARIYRVPLHMIQSVAGSTSWGSGLAEMSLGFVRFTLDPWMVPLEQEYNSKLFTETEKRAGLYVRHDTTDLLRADAEARSAYYTAALDPETGWLTREEVRAAEDRNPLTSNENARFAENIGTD